MELGRNWSCSSVGGYELLERIGCGSFASVFRAKHRVSRNVVALKRTRIPDGHQVDANLLREVTCLQQLSAHENIVRMHQAFFNNSKDEIWIVMDFCPRDLRSFLQKSQHPLPLGQAKGIVQTLLTGLEVLHENWWMHRDLKPANLLITESGRLQIADVNLARKFSFPAKPCSPEVVTLAYRAPELLLGTEIYTSAIDVWSVGCIFAETLTGEPLLPGTGELDQIRRIFRLLGTPNECLWPGYGDLPVVRRFRLPIFEASDRLERFVGRTAISKVGVHLLRRLLCYEPEKRIGAEKALKHDWFSEVPKPSRLQTKGDSEKRQSRKRTSGDENVLHSEGFWKRPKRDYNRGFRI